MKTRFLTIFSCLLAFPALAQVPTPAAPPPAAAPPAAPAGPTSATNAAASALTAITGALPTSANFRQPSPGEKPANLAGWNDSLMFPAAGLNKFLEGLVFYDLNKDRIALLGTGDEMGTADKIPEIPADSPEALPRFRLSSIVFDPTWGWQVMIGKQRITPATNKADQELRILGVTRESVTLRWEPKEVSQQKALLKLIKHPKSGIAPEPVAEAPAAPATGDMLAAPAVTPVKVAAPAGLPQKNRVAALVPRSNMTAGVPIGGDPDAVGEVEPENAPKPGTPSSVRFTLRLNQTFVPRYMAIYEGNGPGGRSTSSVDGAAGTPLTTNGAPKSFAPASTPAADATAGSTFSASDKAAAGVAPMLSPEEQKQISNVIERASDAAPKPDTPASLYPIPADKSGLDNVSATINNLLKSKPQPSGEK